MSKYKLIEKDGEQIIERSDFTHEFTPSALTENIRLIRKQIKEITAQKELDSAKMTNYSNYHPFVLDLSEEDLKTAFLYQTAKEYVNICENKLKELENCLEEEIECVKQVEKQTGLVIEYEK